ncbi:MAG: DUF2933 domain-containing protein [Nitrospira sp.]|nr:DUF2933 domain-containing protein [Nitrospira sp.]
MSDPRSSPSTRPWIVLCAFLAITGFFLLTEHRAHLFGLLPYLLLLACPLLHLFLHGRHRPHEATSRPESEPAHQPDRGGGHGDV